jgi:hypothetical protein
MKVLFKYVLTLLVFLVSATAGQDQVSRSFDRHINGVRSQNLNNINNMVFGDRDTYGATGRTVPNIKEIIQSQARNETIPLVQDRNIWADQYWNYMVLIRFVDGVKNERLSCDEGGLDALRATLCQQYPAFSSKVNNAIEDDKKHCANLDLFNFISLNLPRNLVSRSQVMPSPTAAHRPTPASQPALMPHGAPPPAPAHWQSETIIPDNNHYVLRDQRYRCAQEYYALSDSYYCPEVLVHPYNGSTTPPMEDFNARIPMTAQLLQNIRDNLLPQAQLAQELVITVQNFLYISNSPEEMLFRPQHAFFHHYHGANIQSNVDCWGKWWASDGASMAFAFPSTMTPVSIHSGDIIPGSNSGQRFVKISSNTHGLGFRNDDQRTRVVLSSTYFTNGPIGGTTKTALNFIFTEEAWERWEELREQGRPIGDIFREMFRQGHIPIEVMNLLEIQ